MKKIIFVLMIIGINILYSQTNINPPKLSIVDTDTTITRTPLPFILGWNWG